MNATEREENQSRGWIEASKQKKKKQVVSEEKKEREIHVPVATLFLPCDGFYVLEKSFDNILLPCIFLSIIALKLV